MKFDPRTTSFAQLDKLARERGQLGKVATAKGLIDHRQSSLQGRAGSVDQTWRRLPAPSEATMRAALEEGLPAIQRRSARERYRVLIKRLYEDGKRSYELFGYPVWPKSVQDELRVLGFTVGNPDLQGQVEALARKYLDEGARKQKAKDQRKVTLDWSGTLFRMTAHPDREEIAWAAGFFDGEGYVSCIPRGKGVRLILRVDQSDPVPLERFRDAVGVGRVRGPYKRSPSHLPHHKPKWNYAIESHKAAAVVAMLWGFLSAPKREQSRNALVRWKYLGVQRGQRLSSALDRRSHISHSSGPLRSDPDKE